jgi:hypothetical protein
MLVLLSLPRSLSLVYGASDSLICVISVLVLGCIEVLGRVEIFLRTKHSISSVIYLVTVTKINRHRCRRWSNDPVHC